MMKYCSVVIASSTPIPFNLQVIISYLCSSFGAYGLASKLMVISSYISFDAVNLIQGMTNITIPNHYFNDNKFTSFIVSNITDVRYIEIGNNSLTKVRVFELNGLSELESVVIGQDSFSSDGSYRIVNCPKLKSIRIGDNSFKNYRTFVMTNLPSLESIEFGNYCFESGSSFSLIGMNE